MSNQLKLVVGVPSYGMQVTAYQARQWLEFGHTLGGSTERFALVGFSTVDSNPVDRARNELLANARSVDADWLLMIDADTWVDGYAEEDAGFQILRMISDAERREAVIVAAPVCQRGHGHLEMIYRLPRDKTWGDRSKLIALFDDDYSLRASRHLVAIDAAATAVMAIAIKRLPTDASFRFNYELGLSEDIDFCRQVYMARPDNHVIFCDPRVHTGHVSRSYPLPYSPPVKR